MLPKKKPSARLKIGTAGFKRKIGGLSQAPSLIVAAGFEVTACTRRLVVYGADWRFTKLFPSAIIVADTREMAGSFLLAMRGQYKRQSHYVYRNHGL